MDVRVQLKNFIFGADCCRYHPGGPVFHDAIKRWSCCKKSSTDFTEFLNTPVSLRRLIVYHSAPQMEMKGVTIVELLFLHISTSSTFAGFGVALITVTF